MMKLNKFAFTGAIALAGAMGFTACSSDDDITSGQNPTFNGETVKTQFTINVPAGNPKSRLSDEITQGQATPVFRGMDNIHMFSFTDDPFGTSSTPADIYANMGSILTNELMETSNAKVYYDMEITENVNRFLFYGEATRAEGATDAMNGRLNPTYPTTGQGVSTIKFELQPITTGSNTEIETKLLEAMNKVAHVSGWSETDNVTLKSLYLSYITLKAGSANSIRQALTYLQEGVNAVQAEGDVATLKTNIINAIDEAINSTTGTIKDLTYPRELGLPDGAVQVSWDSASNKFVYATNSGNVWGTSQAAITDYVYPAALYYWANSTIKVSNETESDQYSGTWDNILSLYTDGTKVTPSTRSVALDKQINYGVARFDLAAYLKGVTLKDNVGEDISVGTNNGISIVGLLVGGQKAVQYDFSTPVNDTKEKPIYDNAIKAAKLSTSSSTDVLARTLVLETAAAAAAGEGTVRFALELENNTGDSFVGNDGTVPNGGRFYLVGELEPSLELSTTEEEKKEHGTYLNGMDGRVFKQDFTTKANVSITSLAHAYNCIPDLRSPRLELGLSVNLDWQTGLVDEVVID